MEIHILPFLLHIYLQCENRLQSSGLIWNMAVSIILNANTVKDLTNASVSSFLLLLFLLLLLCVYTSENRVR